MNLTQKTPAAALAVLVGATWAVPAAVSHAVRAPETTVAAPETATLRSTEGASLDYRAPVGWTTSPSAERSSVTYTREDGAQRLDLAVVGGSQDFDTTADRVLRQQALGGTSAAFDGGTLTSRSGFTGKSCVAVRTEDRATGPCAVVHREDLVVVVTVTSTGKDQAPDLQALVDGFRLVPGDAA